MATRSGGSEPYCVGTDGKPADCMIRDIDTKKLFVMRGSSSLKLKMLLGLVETEGKAGHVVQVFDPDAVISADHLFAAYLNAKTAFKNRSNISDRIGMEMLLFTAMTRQVREAIARAGAKSSRSFILFTDSRKALDDIGKEAKLSRADFDSRHVRDAEKAYGMQADPSNPAALTRSILVRMMSSRLTA